MGGGARGVARNSPGQFDLEEVQAGLNRVRNEDVGGIDGGRDLERYGKEENEAKDSGHAHPS
jgi:hypothetical protein